MVLTALLLAPRAGAAPAPPLGHEGRWITDDFGRVVILHGVNMVYKRPPYAPDATGFGNDDAIFLARHGFNTVRLGLIYAGVEPQPGVYSNAYLGRIANTERILAEHGIFSQLDFHQDLYNERYQGEGWPEWAVQDDGLPAEPKVGFPGNYLVMPALNRAFDHFWANDPGPGGVGLQDRYAAAFRHVAQRFVQRRRTLGYDIVNEPWAGSVYPSCANPAGCPAFDTGTMVPFYQRVISKIREVEPQKLIWYEPQVLFNQGADSNIPAIGDPNLGFSFHVYCVAGGAFSIPGFPGQACEAADDLVFENASKQAEETGDALLLSEFGATDDFSVLRRNIASAEREMISWQYWHYCGCDDPTTAGPGVQAVVIDPAQPPRGNNVKAAKLDLLSRAYPQAIAGTPLEYSFEDDAARFTMRYSVERVGGDQFTPVPSAAGVRASAARISPRSPQTEIFIPPGDYPDGYVADVEGAGVASRPNARVLRTAACPGAGRVTVTVRRPRTGAIDGPDCVVAGARRPRLRIRVRPRRAVAGERTCFRIRVTTQGTRVRGARVRFAGKRRRTGRRGRTRICRTFARPGKKFVRARKLGFRPARAAIRVRRPR